MIIYHNQHDKNSRDFVAKYGKDHTVYDYPKCIEHCGNISSFPTIVIDVPAYYQEVIIEELLNDDDEFEEMVTEEAGNREAYVELFTFYDDLFDDIDDFWEKAMKFKQEAEKRAKDSPPR